MLRVIMVCAMALLGGCAQTAQHQSQLNAPPAAKPACRAGADAAGIAAGFFSFFTDDLNGCL